MDAPFDPYRKWLGIPREEQPPHHYRLLAIRLFEDDAEVISHAADRQMLHLRSFQSGQHSAESQKLLNEMSAARVCLLDPAKKVQYDARLRAAILRQRELWLAGPPFGVLLKGACRYTWVQARRAWLAQAQLASAHLALGWDLYARGGYRGRLAGLLERLDKITGELTVEQGPGPAVEQSPASQNPGFFARIGAWPTTVGRQVRWMALRFVRRRLLRRLAREAFALDGVTCGPSELAAPLQELRTRGELLRAEARRLAEVPAGQVLSPARLAWIIGGIGLGVVLLVVWLRIVL